jgi:hypothetical protein
MFDKTEEDGILESTCVNDPPGDTSEQTFAYNYNLYLSSTVVSDDQVNNQVDSVERRLHLAIASNFLTCDFETTNFQVSSLSSAPQDVIVTDQACDTSEDPTPPDGAACFVVRAGMSAQVYFDGSRRQLQEPQTQVDQGVLDAFRDYLQTTMADGELLTLEIVMLSFQGFFNVNLDAGNTTPDDRGDIVAGVQSSGNVNASDGNPLAVGSSVVAFAAAALVVVAIVAIRKRNGRRDAYLKHLEELSQVSEISLDERGGLGVAPRVYLVNEEDNNVDFDLDSLDENMRETEEEYMQHDVHQCASATCPVCRGRTIQPTFLSTDLEHEMRQQLGPTRFHPNKDRSYRTPDTVDL